MKLLSPLHERLAAPSAFGRPRSHAPQRIRPSKPLKLRALRETEKISRSSEMFCEGSFQKWKRHGSPSAIHQTPRTKLSNLIRALSLSISLELKLEVEHERPSSLAFFGGISVFSEALQSAVGMRQNIGERKGISHHCTKVHQTNSKNYIDGFSHPFISPIAEKFPLNVFHKISRCLSCRVLLLLNFQNHFCAHWK